MCLCILTFIQVYIFFFSFAFFLLLDHVATNVGPRVIICKIIFLFSLDFFKFMTSFGNYIYSLFGKVVTKIKTTDKMYAQLIRHALTPAHAPPLIKAAEKNNFGKCFGLSFHFFFRFAILIFFPVLFRDSPKKDHVTMTCRSPCRHTNQIFAAHITRFVSPEFFFIESVHVISDKQLYSECHRFASGYI